MNFLSCFAMVCSAVAASAPVCANTINFDSLASNGPAFYEVIEDEGFQISGPPGDAQALGVWPESHPYQADTQGVAVYVNRARAVVTLSRPDGRAFDIHSIDVTDLLNTGEPLTLDFTFVYLDGHSEAEEVSLAAEPGLKTLLLERQALRQVSWRAVQPVEGWSQFDNLVATLTGP
jgi:hypothetical protein